MSAGEQYRAGFEAWALSQGLSIHRVQDQYEGYTFMHWRTWLASKREASTEPSAWMCSGSVEPEFTADALLAGYWMRKGRPVTPLYVAAGALTDDAIPEQDPARVTPRFAAPASQHESRELARRLEITQILLEQERMKNAHLLDVMMRIYNLAPNGQDIKLPDGRVFRFNDPSAAETLNALGRAIHAIPEQAAQALASGFREGRNTQDNDQQAHTKAGSGK